MTLLRSTRRKPQPGPSHGHSTLESRSLAHEGRFTNESLDTFEFHVFLFPKQGSSKTRTSSELLSGAAAPQQPALAHPTADHSPGNRAPIYRHISSALHPAAFEKNPRLTAALPAQSS